MLLMLLLPLAAASLDDVPGLCSIVPGREEGLSPTLYENSAISGDTVVAAVESQSSVLIYCQDVSRLVRRRCTMASSGAIAMSRNPG